VRAAGILVWTPRTWTIDLAEMPYQASKRTDLASKLMNLSSGTFFKTDKGNLGVPLRMTGKYFQACLCVGYSGCATEPEE